MKTWRFLGLGFQAATLGFVVIVLTGCAGIIPLPATSKVQTGHRLAANEVSFIKPGQTTRSEVVARLGTNYLSLPRDTALAYSWEVKGGGGVWWFSLATPWGSIAQGDFWVGGWRAFYIAFDEHQVVTSTAFERPSPRHSLHEQLWNWYRRLTGKAPVSPPDTLASPGSTIVSTGTPIRDCDPEYEVCP